MGLKFKRVIIAYNKESSRYGDVKREVLDKLEKYAEDFNFTVKHFLVLKKSVEKNAERLGKELKDGDLVIVAGGDGTATAVLNGVINSKRQVKLAVLPYGHFNDMARTLKCKKIEQIFSGEVKKFYPLEAKIDGKHFRYAGCYFTIGMFAESTEIFNIPDERKKIKKGSAKIYAFSRLFKWWRKNRKREFLPKDLKATDILAINGRTVARVMRGRRKLAFSSERFIITKRKLSGFFGIGLFMMKSIVFRISGKTGTKMRLKFADVIEVEIQAEGEYEKKKCREIIITKPVDKGVDVVYCK